MVGGDVAVEVVIARCAGTAAAGVHLFHHDHVGAAALGCGDGSHQTANATANNEEIGFNTGFDGNHERASLEDAEQGVWEE